MSQFCPCGSKQDYSSCCGPYLNGTHFAPQPVMLMRSRYSAFVLKNADYLVATWHPSCQADAFKSDIEAGFSTTRWLGLTVYEQLAGRHEQEGYVSFVARFQENEKNGVIIERSRFLNENGRWFYIDGVRPQFSRNDPCPCGSGKKFKKCCGQ